MTVVEKTQYPEGFWVHFQLSLERGQLSFERDGFFVSMGGGGGGGEGGEAPGEEQIIQSSIQCC